MDLCLPLKSVEHGVDITDIVTGLQKPHAAGLHLKGVAWFFEHLHVNQFVVVGWGRGSCGQEARIGVPFSGIAHSSFVGSMDTIRHTMRNVAPHHFSKCSWQAFLAGSLCLLSPKML